MSPEASVAVIGGSGLYRLFDPEQSETRRVATPDGPVEVTLGELGGRTAAFITRHDSDAELTPAAGTVDPDAVSHELVLKRLAEAQPRIVAAIETIIRAMPDEYAPRELIAAAEVAAVLARSAK